VKASPPTIHHKLLELRQTLNLSQEEAAQLIGVTSTTLSRWTNRHTARMDTAHEARLDLLLALLNEAKETIKAEGVAGWFKTPHPYLSDLRPLDLLGSPSGTAKVQAMLGAMRWGLPA
jgi:putative toxin-antitoxin system antitoxin component (TIGR02293 family)